MPHISHCERVLKDLGRGASTNHVPSLILQWWVVVKWLSWPILKDKDNTTWRRCLVKQLSNEIPWHISRGFRWNVHTLPRHSPSCLQLRVGSGHVEMSAHHIYHPKILYTSVILYTLHRKWYICQMIIE